MASRGNRQVISLLGAMVALLLVGACQPAAAPAPKEAPPKAEEKKPAPPPAVVKQPKYGGTLRVGIRGDPSNLDPHLTTAFTTVTALSLVYPRLLQWNLGSDQDPLELKIIPDFAEKWELEGDRTYVFHLRQGVKWHNKPPVNGREVTSADVKWSFERMKGTATGWVMAPVERIETPDKYTVKFVLKEPTAPFLANVSHSHPRIAPREIADEDKDLKKRAVGFGPYIFEQWERNVQISLKKNPDYFQQGLPYLDRIETLIIPEESVALAAFLTGEIDISSDQLTVPDWQQASKARPELLFERIQRAWWFGIWMRLDKEPLGDLRVRKAMSLAINRDKINQAVAYGQGLWLGPLPASLGDWVLAQEELRKLYPHDVAKAKQLLAEAGYPSGFKTTALSTEQTGQVLIDIAQMVKEQLKAVAIDVDVSFPERGEYQKRRNEKDYMLNIGNFSAFTDPDEYFAATYRSGVPRNYSMINDPELDRIIDKQKTAFDSKVRKELVTGIQRYLADKQYIIHLITPSNYWGWHPAVKNFRPHGVGSSNSSVQLASVWLDR